MRRTLGVVCELCVIFSYICLCHALVIYALILFGHSFFHVINSLKDAEIKMRKNKGPTLLQGAGLHRQINKTRFKIKIRKVNILIIYYKALGQIHYIHKRNKKINARKELRIECEGVGPKESCKGKS